MSETGPKKRRGARPAKAAEPQLPLGSPTNEARSVPAGLGAPAVGAGPVPATAARAASRASGAELLEGFFYREDEEGPDLGIEESPADPRLSAGAEERREYLSFWLGDEEYALPIRQIREIQKPPPITEVPRAPAHVLGVVTLRGEVLPVFDPKLRLHLPRTPPDRHARVVIVDGGDGRSGVFVDRVGAVVRLADSEIEPTPRGFEGLDGELLAGVGRTKDRMLILLDLAGLLRTSGRAAGERA